MISPRVIFICIALSILQAHGQEKVIVFQNIFSGKKVELKAGDEVHLRFTVHDTADAPFDIAISDVTLFGTIESIGDSSLLIVSKNKTFDRVSLNVPLKSIEAFRKYSRLRPALKVAVSVAAASTGLLISLQIANSSEIFSFENAGLAVGTTSAAIASRQIFSDKMKYFVMQGWRGKVAMKI